MSFSNLEQNSDTSTTDYIFRADVVDADGCEGGGMGKERYFYKVDEDPETPRGHRLHRLPGRQLHRPGEPVGSGQHRACLGQRRFQHCRTRAGTDPGTNART